MGIAALPANAIRAIGSTQCITDPVSLVKELVENSLDAKATSVHIEIASNAIDRIKVRDNGHGFAPEDRSLVCKRYCTSKIRSLGDLHDLGGQSLGFRGEALASALELSLKLLVSTRIEGEETAVEIGFREEGLVESERRISHSVGTTVQIDQFLSKFPVRKQLAEKNYSKILNRIKSLLQRYALARPGLRISLKVIKAKTSKVDWGYSPRNGLTEIPFRQLVLDAAIKIFGTKAAETLLYQAYSWTPAGEIEAVADREFLDHTSDLEDRYLLECLLIDPTSLDNTACMGLGQHIAIDNRPVSCDRGVMKEVARRYKVFIRSAAERLGIGNMPDPLLVMNLKCPKGSYDINVEPAKDDVLFYDVEYVLGKVRLVFEKVYGEKQDSSKRQQHITDQNDQFDILLAKPASANTPSPRKTSSPGSIGLQSTDIDVDVSSHSSNHNANTQIQGLYSGIDRSQSEQNEDASPSDEDELDLLATRNAKKKTSMAREEGALDVWLQRSRVSNSPNDHNTTSVPGFLLPRLTQRPGVGNSLEGYENSPVSASLPSLPQRGLSLEDIPVLSQRPRGNKTPMKPQTRNLSKPFTSPVNDPEHVWFDIGETQRSRKPQQSPSKRIIQSSPISVRENVETIPQPLNNVPGPIHPDLALALDYETRKSKATQDHREHLRNQKAVNIARQEAENGGQLTIDSLFAQYPARPVPKSPHKNRQAKALAALRTETVAAVDGSTERKKMKLKMLPLESVQEENWVSDLVLPLLTTVNEIENQMGRIVDWDDFISHGEVSNELGEMELGIPKAWEIQIRQLLHDQYRKRDAHGEAGASIEEHDMILHLREGFSESDLQTS